MVSYAVRPGGNIARDLKQPRFDRCIRPQGGQSHKELEEDELQRIIDLFAIFEKDASLQYSPVGERRPALLTRFTVMR
jgi:hypothetical protein